MIDVITDERILKVLGSVYDAVGHSGPGAWLGVYTQMAHIFSSGPGALSLYDLREDKFQIIATTLPPKTIKLYNDYYHPISPFRSVISKMKAGDVFRRSEHMSDKDFERTEIYRDFYSKLDMYEFEYRILCEAPGLIGGVTFSRPKGRTAFTPDEQKAMSMLMPHLMRAMDLHITLTLVRHENKQMIETLSRLPQSVIVLNRAAKIIFSNAAAELIIGRRDGLIVDRENVLSASRAQDTRKLRAALESAFQPRPADSKAGRVLQISRSDLRPLQIAVTPFSDKPMISYASEPLALMFVHDRDQPVETVKDTLGDLYGLTRAESRLAGILAQGRSLKEACEMLDISSNTARTHLKRIFSKTDTNRQSALITLILSSPANLKESA